MHVLIVGAGLGGLSLAQCLRKQGISYEIFERDENEDSRFQGWAIGIHSIIGDLLESFPDDMPDMKKATNHLEPLGHLDAQMALYFPGSMLRMGVQDNAEAPVIRAERHRLRHWLSTNIDVKWNKRVFRIHEDEDGVEVHFEDGTSAKGDLLVGADGIKSVVRQHLTGRNDSELLKVIPIGAIIGEVTLSGEEFKRQLELGHSAYVYVRPDLGFWSFCALHHVLPDGLSGRYYWMFMQPEPTVAQSDNWLQTASQQQKLEHVLKAAATMPPKFRELFELTPIEGIRAQPHIWRDLELDALPSGRTVLVGDAAHAMTPFRGEGGYHAFIDSLNLAKLLSKPGFDIKNKVAVQAAVAEYNAEMLERGADAVRNSRNEQGAKKTKDGKMMSAGQVVRPLPASNIVLGVPA